MPALCFVDTETTSLDRHKRVAWEIAMVRREEDGSEKRIEFQMELTNREVNNADPVSLDIGGFDERYDEVAAYSRKTAAALIAEYTHEAILVGRQVHFDADNLSDILEGQGQYPTWNYRLFDVMTLAKGYLLNHDNITNVSDSVVELFDGGSERLAEWLGVNPSDFASHTAMGDVEYDMAVYDAIQEAVYG